MTGTLTESNPTNNIPNDDSVKIVVEERIDDQGRRIRVTRKIRLRLISEKVSQEVSNRRNWRKFGDASNDGNGPQVSSTIIGEPVFLKLSTGNGGDTSHLEGTKSVMEARNIACRYCQGAHWTAKCPYKATFAEEVQESVASSGKELSKTKYIPPSQRRSQEATLLGATTTTSSRDNPNTIRISNLSDVVTDDDIRDLVTRLAQPARVYVVKDPRTGLCRGSAYVSFLDIDDAERCMKILNGHPYGNLILRVEMARPQQ